MLGNLTMCEARVFRKHRIHTSNAAKSEPLPISFRAYLFSILVELNADNLNSCELNVTTKSY